MDIKYSDGVENNDGTESLTAYRAQVRAMVDALDFTQPESALATWGDELMRSGIREAAEAMGDVSHVVVIGIGGSSLGTEAIHNALEADCNKKLYVLDSVSDYRIRETITALAEVPLDEVAVCAISKSGGTTETMTNLDVFMHELRKLHGLELCPYERLVCVGNEGNSLLQKAAALGAHVLPMHEAIGGRFSVFTSVGLLPLQLLGHNTEGLLSGLGDTFHQSTEEEVVIGATALFNQLQAGVRTVNFFTFDSRLDKLGQWYRQLTAESLGKEKDEEGNKVEIGFVPTISTPTELHSIGQLYFSGFSGVFTDFVAVKDNKIEYQINEESVFAEKLYGRPMQEISHAIEQGVVAAYNESKLPYRKTDLPALTETALGQFMGMRMLETIYLAKLMNVNAFNQPNVELYKIKTKEVLDGQ